MVTILLVPTSHMSDSLESLKPQPQALWPPSSTRQVLVNSSAPCLNYHTVLTTSSFQSTSFIRQLFPRVAKGGPLQG